MVNDHTRSAENWKCVWYLLRLYIYRVYVDSHSLGQLALASKRTASTIKQEKTQLFDDPIRTWQELLETHVSSPVSSSR